MQGRAPGRIARFSRFFGVFLGHHAFFRFAFSREHFREVPLGFSLELFFHCFWD